MARTLKFTVGQRVWVSNCNGTYGEGRIEAVKSRSYTIAFAHDGFKQGHKFEHSTAESMLMTDEERESNYWKCWATPRIQELVGKADSRILREIAKLVGYEVTM